MRKQGRSPEEVRDTLKKRLVMESRAVQPSSGGSELMGYIKKYFPEEEWGRAYKVAMGESGGRVGAVGDKYPIRGVLAPSYGYFQIRALPGRPSPKELLDPEFNVKYASDLFKSQGWSPWTVARNLGYVK